jgi:hypothetical protein
MRKDMQGKADETECPRIWPGATVGSESLNGNPESLSALVCDKRLPGEKQWLADVGHVTDTRLEQWILSVRCLRDEQASVRLRSGESAYV